MTGGECEFYCYLFSTGIGCVPGTNRRRTEDSEWEEVNCEFDEAVLRYVRTMACQDGTCPDQRCSGILALEFDFPDGYSLEEYSDEDHEYKPASTYESTDHPGLVGYVKGIPNDGKCGESYLTSLSIASPPDGIGLAGLLTIRMGCTGCPKEG